ncbi:MAG: carboxypeptidase-like regulatory domain-containing protein [candidate division KSB1 bacterium]|nr:carboxypeptidase-like regulatory domain-containing protein [candidate division KSB1 bacterium]
MWRRGISVSFIVLAMAFAACFNNAERDNPLDPKSDQYQNSGRIDGHVYTYYAPFKPLPAARLTASPLELSVWSDPGGAFSFANMTPGAYSIKVDATGYAMDSATVNVEPGRTVSLTFFLDGLPRLDSLRLVTGYVHESFPIEPSQLIDCQAKVGDPDGYADIDSVSMIIPDFNMNAVLPATTRIGYYQKRLLPSDLPVVDVEAMLGHPIFIKISDRVGQIRWAGPFFLVRVIQQEPIIESPRGSSLVNSKPLFKWKALQLPFPFTFRLEVYRIIDPILFELSLNVSNLPSATLEYQAIQALRPGSYLWTISVVDEFGNWSSSIRATFQVGG